MRYESSVTSVSWIPSEAMTGMMRLPMDMGVGHYDDPLPDHIDDLEAMRQNDQFRFANHLSAWVEVEDGKITDAGYSGAGMIGSTTLRLGVGEITVPAVGFPDLQEPVKLGESSARFVQTGGGRTGAPMPRRVTRAPFVQITAPTAWTTLALTINADGTSQFEVAGASSFPRHWIYNEAGDLAAKSGFIDFETWSRKEWADNTPWGDVNAPALVTEVETALERELSLQIMRGGKKPKIRKVNDGEALITQGEPGNELFLLLDGVLAVEVDGEAVAEVGPGAILGERALIEEGVRTSTLRAVTPAKAAVAGEDEIDPGVLTQIAEGHKREED